VTQRCTEFHSSSKIKPSGSFWDDLETDRKEMISLLETKGITDPDVLAAMAKVERHLFVEAPFVNRAYEDSALPIGYEQTISQPYTVAYMTQALAPKPGDKVLEVGNGVRVSSSCSLKDGMQGLHDRAASRSARRGQKNV